MTFESIHPQPPLARTVMLERFAADARPDKLLLASGAFKNELGATPLFDSVRIATERVHQRGISRDYLPIAGDASFIAAMEQLLCGARFSEIAPRIRTAQTPGGTAALWVGAMLIRSTMPQARIWVSNPTWGNHIKVFEQAGLEIRHYPYYDAASRKLKIDEMHAAVEQIPAGDVLFLQAAPHNPTGLDPNLEQWRTLRHIIRRQGVTPFFDAAFFGFASGLGEDLAGIFQLLEEGGDVLVATSMSKSMSFYNERVGSLSVVGSSPRGALSAFSHVEHLIRGSYSNPPLHGVAIAAEVLTDPDLFAMWNRELEEVRSRIASLRKRLTNRLSELAKGRDFAYVERERGLFTKFDLAERAVDALQDAYGLHLGPTGRCNVTAIPDARFEEVCRAIAAHLE